VLIIAFVVSIIANLALLRQNELARRLLAFNWDDLGVAVVVKGEVIKQCGYQMDKGVYFTIRQAK
jgi:hypothetical protein